MESTPTTGLGAEEPAASRLTVWHHCSLEEANAEAVRRIEVARAESRVWLDLGDLPIVAVPREIGRLKDQLQLLTLGRYGIDSSGRMREMQDGDRPGFVSDLTTLSLVPNLTTLDLSGCGQISDLTPVGKLLSLTSLNLNRCGQISDLTPVGKLLSLTSLDLGICRSISDLTPLSTLLSLTWLSLGYCEQVSDLTLLGKFRHLTNLDLSECRSISDLTHLGMMPNLTKLDLSGCRQVSDLTPLGTLPHLTSLNLYNCEQVSDLTPLGKFRHLTKLDLSECRSISDLTPLGTLLSLTWLNLSGCGQVSDLTPVGKLLSLTLLDLSICRSISDLTPLGTLLSLTWLSLGSCEQVSDLTPVGKLLSLTWLSLNSCEQVSDLTPVGKLLSLTFLDLGICRSISDLTPLGTLLSLTWLSLSSCKQVSDLTPVGKLLSLTSLNLYNCEQVSDLTPLGRLLSLTSLGLSSCGQVSDLTPLGTLLSLTSLDLGECVQMPDLTPVGKLLSLTSLDLGDCVQMPPLTPLGTLLSLTSLDLSGCGQVLDLTPLGTLSRLARIHLDHSRAVSFAPLVTILSNITYLTLFCSKFPDLHQSVQSRSLRSNCIESVRQYYESLDKIPVPDSEIKVFVLGNGRVGKTYLVQRLKDHSFAEIESRKILSTHGVRIEPYQAPDLWNLPHPVRLCLWDFGGQDIYHGTHALFLREPAVYLLLYSEATENDGLLTDGGFVMRNRRLPYWFDYLRQEAGTDGVVTCPVLLLHAQCDAGPEPYSDTEPEGRPAPGRFLRLSKVIPVSSKDPIGLDFFRPHLWKAITDLLREHPQPPLPKSWAAVRQAIRDKQPQRMLSQAEFRTLCAQSGCESNAVVLCDALHQMGAVFYRKGLFGDQIIVDQSWVLEKVYTIFDRRNLAFQQEVRDKHGKFRRSDLERFFWPTDAIAEQRVYLSFMEQCGICFRAEASYASDYEGLYIAPDLLPRWEGGPQDQYAWWPQNPDVGVTASYAVLHDGIARGFLSRIGRRAGDRAEYWRFGCYFYDGATGSQALIRTVGNAIRLEAQGGAAADLLQTLQDILHEMPSGQLPNIPPRDAHSPPPQSSDARAAGNPEDRLKPVPRPTSDQRLARLGAQRYTRIAWLRTFYLMGCAYHSRIQSLNDIAKILDTCDLSLVPEGVGTSRGSLSNHHRGLAKLVGVQLVEVSEKRETSALTPDGERLWTEIECFLLEEESLPDWQKIYESARRNNENK